MKNEIKRLAGYILGFILFYAPFALFQKIVFYIIYGRWMDLSIHSLCIRIPLEHILDGRIFRMNSGQIVCVVILVFLTIFLGPVFCGKLCPAGALTEYLSRLVPKRFQINWSKHVDIVPIRYGMLFGFMVIPFFNGILACAYCNFFIFDLIANYFIFGYTISLTTSLLITLLLDIFLFGLFTEGGRGFCNLLCPVGAFFSLCWFLGRKAHISTDISIEQNLCVKCGKCKAACPMEAICEQESCMSIEKHHCILCGKCKDNCPKHAIVKK